MLSGSEASRLLKRLRRFRFIDLHHRAVDNQRRFHVGYAAVNSYAIGDIEVAVT
jgi:hypothetical protein